MDFVAEKEALAHELRRQLRALTARCGAEIQHSVPRLHLQKLRRHHGARLLNIVDTRVMIGMLSGLQLRFIVIAVFRPRNRSKLCQKARSCLARLQGIHPKSLISLLFKAGKKFPVFFPQHLLHSI